MSRFSSVTTAASIKLTTWVLRPDDVTRALRSTLLRTHAYVYAAYRGIIFLFTCIIRFVGSVGRISFVCGWLMELRWQLPPRLGIVRLAQRCSVGGLTSSINNRQKKNIYLLYVCVSALGGMPKWRVHNDVLYQKRVFEFRRIRSTCIIYRIVVFRYSSGR